MNWYFQVLKKYAVFSGRARRKEYWMFLIFNLSVCFVLGFIEGFSGITPKGNHSVLGRIYVLAVLIPIIAVAIRRMHDTDHRGWWILVPIVSWVFLCLDSTPGNNRFGPNPKAIS